MTGDRMSRLQLTAKVRLTMAEIELEVSQSLAIGLY